MNEPRFVYDRETDSYILKSDKRIVIDCSGHDLVFFSNNQYIQSSGMLYLNAIPHYEYKGDLELYVTMVNSKVEQTSKEIQEALYSNDYTVNESGTVCLQCSSEKD